METDQEDHSWNKHGPKRVESENLNKYGDCNGQNYCVTESCSPRRNLRNVSNVRMPPGWLQPFR